jgi:hypothetical protein
MAEDINGKTNGARSVAVSVELKNAEHITLPVIANYTDINVVQGVAYLNFGFIEPALLMEVGKRSKKEDTAPTRIEGSLTTRVAIPLDSLLRLQQQLTQVLTDLQRGRVSKQG